MAGMARQQSGNSVSEEEEVRRLKTDCVTVMMQRKTTNPKKEEEIKKMTQIEKSPKIQRMEQRLRQMEAEYKQALREEREKERKAQERHKYMMGGCVVKYFPEAYDFSEPEMNRIIACAFSLKNVKNMIAFLVPSAMSSRMPAMRIICSGP